MAEDASHFCKDLDLGEPARALLRPGLSPRQFIEALEEQDLYPDAIRVLARTLPKPRAVAWACQCIRQALPRPTEPERQALELAEQWARDPIEERRRAAKPAADAVGFAHPAGAVAMAAFLSGGSMAPANVPSVPPADHLTARAVAGAILLAAALGPPDEATARLRQFLDLGHAAGST